MLHPVYTSGFGIAKYLLIGDGEKFLSQLSFYRGMRLRLEQTAMRLRAQPLAAINHEMKNLNDALEIVADFLSLGRDLTWSALFLVTSWYKPTIIIGCVDKGGSKHFLKVFKDQSKAVCEAERMTCLQHLYGNWFEVPQVEDLAGPLLVTSFVPRLKWPEFQPACSLISQVETSRLKTDEIKTVSMDEILNKIKFHRIVFEKVGLPDTFLDNFLDRMKGAFEPNWWGYPVYISHGDMTPWNLYVTSSSKMALVDSERVGWHSAYSDLLHYIVQPQAVARWSICSSGTFVQLLSRFVSIDEWEAMACLVYYLIEGLATDAEEMCAFSFHKTLRRSLLRKINWLDEILEEMRDHDQFFPGNFLA